MCLLPQTMWLSLFSCSFPKVVLTVLILTPFITAVHTPPLLTSPLWPSMNWVKMINLKPYCPELDFPLPVCKLKH